MVALKSALTEEAKKATFTKWATGLYKPINSIIGSIKTAAKSSALEDLTTAVSKVSGGISKGISIVPAVAGVFTTAISGISAYMGRFKEIKALKKLKKTHKDTERKGEFAEAVAYGAKKAVRGAWIAMLNLAVSVIQAIVSALSAIAAFIGLFIPWVAIVAAALTGLAAVIGIVKMAGSVGRKIKGIIKFVKGTRGKNRAKNAGIIVDTARGKDDGKSQGTSERTQAVQLIKDLKPDGLLGLLTANVKDVQIALNGASEKDIDNLKKGMAKKLKSS